MSLISRIPGASEGLFARVEIETGTTIAFYNGSRADPVDFNADTWETNNYRCIVTHKHSNHKTFL